MEKILSDKVINRLTLYHCILTDCIRKGTDSISSTTIAGLLRIDDSQVRKVQWDLNHVAATNRWELLFPSTRSYYGRASEFQHTLCNHILNKLRNHANRFRYKLPL